MYLKQVFHNMDNSYKITNLFFFIHVMFCQATRYYIFHNILGVIMVIDFQSQTGKRIKITLAMGPPHCKGWWCVFPSEILNCSFTYTLSSTPASFLYLSPAGYLFSHWSQVAFIPLIALHWWPVHTTYGWTVFSGQFTCMTWQIPCLLVLYYSVGMQPRVSCWKVFFKREE